MTKSELLNILYAERNRVEKQYTLPGWTPWAIYAALASLGWTAWRIIDNGVEWSNVVIGFYVLIFVSITIGCISGVVSQHGKVPLYIKGDTRDRLEGVFVCFIFVGLVIAQLMIIPYSYHPVLYWTALVGTCLLSLLSVSLAVPQHIYYTNVHKGKGAIIIGLLCLPIAVLVVMYLFQMEYEPDSYRLSALLFVMYVLISQVPSDKKKTLSQIDALINKVLYDVDEVDERTILEELEVYIVGLRYGKYLSATKLKELQPLVNTLVNYSEGLIQAIQQGNSAGVDAIMKVGNSVYKDMQEHYNVLMSDVNSIYGDEKNEEKSLEHIIAVGKIAEETMKFWNIAQYTLKSVSTNQTEYIVKAYEKKLRTPEMKQLIEQELVGQEKELG